MYPSTAQKAQLQTEDVTVLKKRVIGKVCGGKCNAGVVYKEGIFYNCSCVDHFNKQILYLSANIPKRFHSFTLDSLLPEFKQHNQESLLIIDKFISILDNALLNGAGLFIQGVSGLAKTAIATYVLKEALIQGKTGYFIHMSELPKLPLQEHRESVNSLLNWILKEVDVLVLDECEKVYNLIDPSASLVGTQFNEYFRKLYDSNKIIILTSNITKIALAQARVHADNVVDRVNSLIDVVLTGNSYRNSTHSIENLLKSEI